MHGLERGRINESFTIPEDKPIDFERSVEFASCFSAIEWGEDPGRREQEKKLFLEAFLRGEKCNPEFHYTKINVPRLKVNIDKLLDMRGRIELEGLNEDIDRAWIGKIDEKISEYRMAIAAAERNTGDFQENTKKLYGTPSEEIYYDSLRRAHETMDRYAAGTESVFTRAVHEARTALPGLETLPPTDPIPMPGKKAVGDAMLFFRSYFARATVPELYLKSDKDHAWISKEHYDSEDIKYYLENLIREYGLNGYSVRVLPQERGRTFMAHNNETKEFWVSQGWRLAEGEMLKKVLHEFAHADFRAAGAKSGIGLLEWGLPGYLEGEEGKIAVLEQMFDLYQKKDESGASDEISDFLHRDRYLAICLAAGIDHGAEGKGRDFCEVFSIMNKYYYFEELKQMLTQERGGGELRADEIERAHAAALQMAWKTCTRTFEGTDGMQRGVYNCRDLVYLSGEIKTWRAIEKKPQELERGRHGRYNLYNDEHCELLDRCGLTMESLPQDMFGG